YNCELQASDVCWSDILANRGYDMGYIGKWHLDSPKAPYINCANNDGELKWNEWCSPDRRHGFKYWHSYGTYDDHLGPMYWDTNAGRQEFQYVDEWGPVHETNLAVEFIERASDPFALVVSMNPPHMPYELVPPRYVDIYLDADIEEWCRRPNVPPAGTEWGDYYRKNIRNYFAMVTGVDEQFGRILNAIDQAGKTDETIVVFTSDHGNCLGIHDKISKSNYYEEAMRIPFLMRWPDKITPRSDDLLFSAPDIYPTLMELMGLSDDMPSDIEGSGFGGLFLGDNQTERPQSQLYMQIPYDRPDYGIRGVRTQQYTLAIDLPPEGKPVVILFDNKADPYQLSNISAEFPEIVQNLIAGELTQRLKIAHDPWIRHINEVIST
ncbi:MAG: sulfatase-like hydrolase/transferase, partial [Spirochaetales bacterium]|nr:sulfatase-like hydrolase/transferase [Spirochaetales bacterium]